PFFRANSFADGHYEMVRALARGIRNPAISHEALIDVWETQPGKTKDAVPSSPKYDEIALQHVSAPKRAFYNRWTPLVLLAIGALVYFLIRIFVGARSRDKSPYEKYQLFDGGLSRLQYLASLPAAAAAYVFEFAHTETWFAPVPAFLAVLFATRKRRSKILSSLRSAPRTCHCGQSMRKLDEGEDDAHIDKGHIAEESIRSMDYDVWVCSNGHSKVEAYKGTAPASPCPKCQYKTYRETSSRTLTAATTSSTGLRETTHTCAHCKHQKVEKHTIPQVSSSSGSSGSSGGGSSGSSGGSFGGGRSGGGGGGSSY
ncbi:MAG TPA: hypothetical protein VK629_03990, partial [Steroidobacteraceae bacterium]|nr:hypothetical protein [Steroidobacteraceae bacterium]